MSLFKKGLQSFVSKIKTYELSDDNVQKVLKEFELMLLKNNVSAPASKEIIRLTKEKIIGQRINRFSNMEKIIEGPIKESILEIVTPKTQLDILEILQNRKEQNIKEPLILLYLGINGTGKTTSIAKMAYMLSKANYRIVIAAADTFRAAAQEQIKEHADRLKIKCIEGPYGGDPGAVVFDAIAHAKARNLHVVLIDTAGRMAINKDLIGEMQKIKRVAQPTYTFLVADALAGNDATSQAKEFDETVGIDATILNKLDADEKSGTALSITYVTKGKPIAYIGTGQTYKDLEKFNPRDFVERLFNV